MRRTQLYLEEEQHRQASRVAAEMGRTLSDVVRFALDEYLTRRRRQRKDFHDAMGQATGLWRERDDLPDLADGRLDGERTRSWPSEH